MAKTSPIESLAGKRRRERIRRRRIVMVATFIAIVIGVGTWQIVVVVTSPASCGTGLVIYRGECVGVTDGSHIFAPSLADVEGKISTENAQVRRTGDYVSVAFLGPLLTGQGSDVTLARIQQELEGAYTAQHYLNEQDYRPQVQLLLANEGSQEQAWQQVTQSLEAEPTSDHLVAVVGVGLSTTPTLQAARALASGPDPIPMIGTVDTADGMNSAGPPASLVGAALSGPITGFVRVEPTTGDEVSLLRGYLRSTLRQAMLVYDTNSSDLYTATLNEDFRAQFGKELIGSEQYDSTPGSPLNANEFNVIANEVCPPGTVNPPTVLYAGRESLLPIFIGQLRGLTMCPGRDITVVTGADAEALPASETDPNPLGPRITVVYPNLVDPTDLTPTYTKAFTTSFGSANLGASWAIMTYDGVAAAEQAARTIVRSTSLLPTRSELRSELFDFNIPANALQGAAGDFLITADGDESCQGLPIITYQNGTVRTVRWTHQHGCP